MKANLLIIAQIENEDPSQEADVQQQAQMARELAFEQEMMLDRETRIRQIEGDILDINQIMRELGSLVQQQGETIGGLVGFQTKCVLIFFFFSDTIENSIDHAAGNVEEGTEQLIKASRYQNKYRKKLLVLVVIAAVIVTILIAVLVTQLKK